MRQTADGHAPSLASRLKALYRRLVPLAVRRALWDLRHHGDAVTTPVAAPVPVSADEPAAAEPESAPAAPVTEASVEAPSLDSDPGPPPVSLAHTTSYVYKWGESLRLLALLRAQPGGGAIEHPVNRQAFKLRGYELADSLGIRHPTVYGIHERAAEVDWDALPERFVVKSKWGCISQRVLLIERRGSEFASMRSDVLMTRDEFAEWLDAEDGRGDPALDQVSYASGETGFWFEQLLDPPPCDWKVYCFDGTPGLVICIDREAKLYRTFDPSFNGWPDAFHTFSFDQSHDLPAPRHPEQLLAAARAMSLALRHPHVSIDLYDMPEGVYFGEATAVPGGGEFMDGEADARLGLLWNEAEARLIAAGYPPFARVMEA